MTFTDLIPMPREVRPYDDGFYEIGPGTSLVAGAGTARTERWLRSEIGAATGFPLPPGAPDGGDGGDVVRLSLHPMVTQDLGEEGYQLEITPSGVHLAGGGPAGLFWGAQTLRQLLGPDAYRRAPLRPLRERHESERAWRLPLCHIQDSPRFAWRGLMLDVARHFMPKDGVLRYLDLLAAHKLNVFHFHLTDDQGWRIEIKRYPKLTETGAWRSRTKYGHRASPLWDEKPHGGYYTQDDIREIVAYAAERHITVVPEIDIPGHSQAAIAAYPELGNADIIAASIKEGTALSVWDTWGINPNILAPTDNTLRFYEGVLEEVLELFPADAAEFSAFVHIGGDECVKDQWKASPTAQARIDQLGLANEDELQSWFIRHFDLWLAERGRRLIGWDEILEGGNRARGRAPVESDGEDRQGVRAAGGETTQWGLAPGAAISSWRGYAGGIAAAQAGHDVVMCPEQQVYLDHRQADGEDEPMPIGYVRTLEDVYRFEPVPPQLGPSEAAHILGTQANVWTEVMENRSRVDYQTFPRLAALAEVAWSALAPSAERDFAGFEERMRHAHYARLDALGVDYRPPGGPLPWQKRPVPKGVKGGLGRPIEGLPPNV
jgi:hexosaminidase